MTLPFETDEMSLLEACAGALAPLITAQGGAFDSAALQPLPTQRMILKRLPGEGAVMASAEQAAVADRLLFAAAGSVPGESLNVEALSRAIERDARRFGD